MNYSYLAGIIVCLILITNGAYAIDSNNITTFSSFQVPNTTDQNITLTCTSTGAGCKTIWYNIDSNLWIQKVLQLNFDYNLIDGFEDGNILSNPIWTISAGATYEVQTAIKKVGDYSLLAKPSAVASFVARTPTTAGSTIYSGWMRTNTNGVGGDVSGFFVGAPTPKHYFGIKNKKWFMRSDSGIDTNLSGGVNSPAPDTWYFYSFKYVAGSLSADLNVYGEGGELISWGTGTMSAVTPTTIGVTGGIMDANTTYFDNVGYNVIITGGSGSSSNFIYSGAGDHNIQYFSTDNSDNNETTKFSQFPMASGLMDLAGSRLRFYGVNYYNGYTVTDWNWTLDETPVSTEQNPFYYTTTPNTDYNVCLTTNNTDTYCYLQFTWDNIAPTIDVNINLIPGFVTNYDVNYSMQCIDNRPTVNYKITKNDTNTFYDSDDANASIKTGREILTPPNNLQLTFTCTDDWNNTATYTTDTIYALTFRLINEETGALLTTADYNGSSRMFIKKIVAFDVDGNFSYDFNATSTIQKNFLGYGSNIWFEITYNNAGTDLMIDRKIDFSLIPDSNIGVCVPSLQTFYVQKFYSVSTGREVYLYQPNAKCYILAGATEYLGGITGNEINTWTINLPYQVWVVNDGIKTFLALINGGVENNYNLDAIAFNQQAVTITVGQDNLAFTPGTADSNTLNIYYKSFKQDYVSTTLTIYNGETQLFTLTEDTNANEFALVWLYTAYGITDQNMLKIIVIGTDAEGNTTTLTEYFNILGDEYLGDKDPSFIAVIVLLFFLFGITMMSVGKTFGWFGIIICVTSMAISLFAVQTYWLLMIEGGLFICFLYILLSGGLVQTFGGMR